VISSVVQSTVWTLMQVPKSSGHWFLTTLVLCVQKKKGIFSPQISLNLKDWNSYPQTDTMCPYSCN